MPGSPPVTATTRIAAPPEVVFPYFTDPALIVAWLGDSADLDPRSGGIFSVHIGSAHALGTYVAVEPPHRVVFTWGLPGNETLPPGTTTVEIVLTGDGGDTVVSLTHTDLPDDHRPSHQEGWIERLGSLPAAVEAG